MTWKDFWCALRTLGFSGLLSSALVLFFVPKEKLNHSTSISMRIILNFSYFNAISLLVVVWPGLTATETRLNVLLFKAKLILLNELKTEFIFYFGFSVSPTLKLGKNVEFFKNVQLLSNIFRFKIGILEEKMLNWQKLIFKCYVFILKTEKIYLEVLFLKLTHYVSMTLPKNTTKFLVVALRVLNWGEISICTIIIIIS